jgi:hypothetical protein
MENQNIIFTIDVAYHEGTAWQALANLWADFDCDADILNVRFIPDVGIWPTFEITTGTVETARAILGRYLDADPFGDDVTEYLREEGAL